MKLILLRLVSLPAIFFLIIIYIFLCLVNIDMEKEIGDIINYFWWWDMDEYMRRIKR